MKFELPKSSPEPDKTIENIEGNLESLGFIEIHSLGEKLESEFKSLSHELSEEINQIPVGTPERTAGEGVLEKFRNSVSRKLQIAIAVLGVVSPLASQAEESFESENFPEVTVGQVQDIEMSNRGIDYQPSEQIYTVIENLHESIWQADHETMVLAYGDIGGQSEIFFIEGEDNTGMVRKDVDTAEQIGEIMYQDLEDNKISSKLGIAIHDHPMSDYMMERWEISEESVEAMQSGERDPAIFPPSMTDLITANDGKYYDDTYEAINLVVEPSGTWTFVKPLDHPVNQIINSDYLPSKEDHAAGFDWETVEISETSDRLYSYFRSLNANIEYRETRVQKYLGYSYSETFLSLYETAESIRVKSIADEDVSDLIKKYIDLAALIGIEVKYEPHTKTTDR